MISQGHQVIIVIITLNDIKIVYPQSVSLSNLGSQSTYDGDWQMYFYIPQLH